MEHVKFSYSVKEKVLILSLSTFAFLFIYVIFGPLDIFANNFDEYIFSIGDFIVPLILIFICSFIILVSAMMFFKGMGINIYTALIVAFIIYGYVDAIFLNKLEFAGGSVNAEYSVNGAMTAKIFFSLMVAILISSALLRKKWKNIIIFTSILFIGMNLAGLVADLLSVNIFKNKTDNMYVESIKNNLEVSQKENIIFFLFDRFDTEYYEDVIKEDPTFFEDLEGFTYYDNNISHYLRSFPSIPYMITGVEYTGQESPEEYLATCYKDSKFLKDLKDNGYSINIYGEKHYTYINADSLLEIADNIEPVDNIEVNKFNIAIYLMAISLYRNSSYYLSLKLISDTNSAIPEKLANIECESGFFKTDDSLYYEKLCNMGLSYSDDEKNYIFIHLKGSHGPFILNENCQKADNATATSQTKGDFLIIKTYLNELKRLGVYDNSTIIISGDHGNPHSDTMPIYSWYQQGYTDYGPTVAMFFKPRNSKNAKLEYSSVPVQSGNLIPSIVQDAKLVTNNNYGYSIKDIEEGAIQNREYYHMIHINKKRKILFDIYDVGDDATDINNWKFKERIETPYMWY